MSALTRFGIPIMLLIGLVSVVYVWQASSSTKETSSALKSLAKGEMKGMIFDSGAPPRPDATISGPDGEVTLADIPTKIQVVNFWSTTCPPCVLEMPTLAELQAHYPEEDVKVIAISFDRVGDHPAAKKELAELTKDRLDFYADPKMTTLFDVKARGFPTTVIYDEKGQEIARYEGDTRWASDESFAFFDAAIAGQK